MGKLLRSYCLESSIVGLKYLYIYPDWISRCFWLLNLIVMLMLSLSMSWLLYWRFQEMPTRITIENQFQSVLGLPYPTITLCSPQQFSLAGLKYFNRSLLDGNRNINFEEVFVKAVGFYEIITEVNDDVMKQFDDLLEQNRYSTMDLLSAMSQPCAHFLKRCVFENKLYLDCGELFKPIFTKFGTCCAFNSMYIFDGRRNIINPAFKNRTVNDYGFVNPLSVVLDSETAAAVPGTLIFGAGILVMLSDWSEIPWDNESFMINSNGESFHALSATYTYCSDEVAALPDFSRTCLFDDERHLDYVPRYRKTDCDLLCYVHAVHQHCGCWLHFVPGVKRVDTCTFTALSCIGRVKLNLIDWRSEERCKCPRDCVSRKYKSDVMLGNFVATPYLFRNVLYNGLKMNESTEVMYFFFASAVYVKLKQETIMSIINIFSNLGGVFGLFMGCSGISVLELLFYLYLWVRNHIRNYIEKTDRNVAPAPPIWTPH